MAGASFILSLVGTLLLPSADLRGVGVLLLVLAAIASVGAWGRINWQREIARSPTLDALSLVPKAKAPAARARLGVFCSVGFLLLSLALFLLNRTEPFGLAGLLWLASMAGLIASLGYDAIRGYTPHVANTDSNRESVPVSTLPVRTARSTYDKAEDNKPNYPWTSIEKLTLLAILGAALLLRVWDLSAYPYNIYPDEIMTGQIAAQSYSGNASTPIFSTVWTGIDLPALWFFLVTLATQVGGTTLAAIRLPAALFGAATVIPLYMLVRDSWGRYAAIASASMLAVSASNIHYSRIALNNIVPQFFWTACFFFVLRGLRTRASLWWLLAGLSGGLSEHFYYGTRLLPFILVGFLIYLLLSHRQRRTQYLQGYTFILTGYVAGMGPLLVYYLLNPGLYFGRGANMLTWNRIPLSISDLQQMWNALWPPFAETLLGISTHGSQDIIYFAPLLLPVEATLVVLGVSLMLWKWRDPAAFLLLLAGMGVLFVGGTLALYGAAPFLAHWTPAFPIFFVAAGIALSLLVRTFSVGARVPVLGPLLLSACLVALAWANFDFYFYRYYAQPESLYLQNYRAAQNLYEIQTVQSRFQASFGPGYRVITMGGSGHIYDPVTTNYLVKGQEEQVVADPQTLSNKDTEPATPTVFLFFAGDEQYQPVVQSKFPVGQTLDVTTPHGKHVFFAYLMGATKVQK